MGQGHEPGPLRPGEAVEIGAAAVVGQDQRLAEAPISTLLSWAWTALVMETDNAVEAQMSGGNVGRLFRISLSSWANGLRLVDEDGVTVADVRGRAGAAANLPGLERWGWLRMGEEEGRRDGYGSAKGVTPETVLRPTRAGTYARRVWPEKVAEVEAAWKARFGAKVIAALAKALGAAGPVRPWGLPQVNPSDGFRTHLLSAEGGATAGSPPSDPAPPLAARLSAVLTAVTREVESETTVSLPMGANFLRILGEGDLATRDVPRLAGISKEAATMGLGSLRRQGLATEADRRLTLTPTGRTALEQFQVEVRARGRAGGSPLRKALVDVLAQGEALVAGLQPPEGCWRAEKPYRAQTERILADPLGALPRQPMVLHRGGWPDGA